MYQDIRSFLVSTSLLVWFLYSQNCCTCKR